MSGGWFVFSMMACIVLCSGFVLAISIMRASWAQREREALTSTDLTAIEESAVLLIDQLRCEADRGIEEIEQRCDNLRTLIAEADNRLARLADALACLPPSSIQIKTPAPGSMIEPLEESIKSSVLQLAEEGMDSADIARIIGLDCAEVKLILSLSKFPTVSLS